MNTSLGSAVLSLDTDNSKFSKGLSDAEGKAKGVTGRIGGIFDTFGKLGLGVFGVTQLAGAVGSLAAGMVSGNAEFERYETQFGVLLGSTELAKKRLEELAEFGAKTPFELPEVVRADKILQGFGLHSEEAAKKFGFAGTDIRTIAGDVAAGTGVSFEEMAGYIGKFSSGATGEVISRFQELGIMTREQMRGMGLEFSKSGELLSPLPEATNTVLNMMKSKFGGMMDAQSGTFEGMMSNLTDWIDGTKRKIMAPIFEVLKDRLEGLLAFLGSPAVVSAIDAFANGLANGIGAVIDGVQTLSNLVQELFSGMNFASIPDFLGMAPDDPAYQNLESIGKLIDSIVTIIRDNLYPILAGLAAMYATVVVPSLIASAGAFATQAAAAIAAGIATAIAMAPVVLALAAVGLAVGLLVAAWQNNWGDIQGKVQAVWRFLEPIFNQVKNWLQVQLAIAIDKLASLWVNTLQPALRSVGEFITGSVVPAFRAIWGFIDSYIFPLLRALAEVYLAAVGLYFGTVAAVWQNVLSPALSALWSFVQATLGPVLGWLANVVLQSISDAMGAAAWTWNNVLGPALSALWDFIDKNINPILQTLAETWLKSVGDGFNGIGAAIGWVIDRLRDLADWLNSLSIPDWLTPGSPTPFENGLRGIGQAMRQLTMAELPRLQMGLSLSGAAGSVQGANQSNVAYSDTVIIQDQAAMAMYLESRRDERLRKLAGGF